MRKGLVMAAVMLLLASCDSAQHPGFLPLEPQYSSQGQEPDFFLIDPQLFPYAEKSDSVRARKGWDAKLRLEYQGIELADEKERVFFELFVTSSSLSRKPDGKPLKYGEAIWIKVRLDPRGYYSVQFEPAGLKFDAPIEVTFSLHLRDFDGDGKVDDGTYVKDHFKILTRENDGAAWEGPHELSISTDNQIAHLKIKLKHFTRFAMATN